jgi:hypothetical protein
MWWGLHIGLPYELVLELPLGELLDLIAVERVQRGDFRLKQEDNGDFWTLMERS